MVRSRWLVCAMALVVLVSACSRDSKKPEASGGSTTTAKSASAGTFGDLKDVCGPGDAKGAALKLFDLKSGVLKGSFALKDSKSLCNDIAIGSDGTAYVTDSFTPNVYSLKPGGSALEVFATDPALTPAKDGVGLDGIGRALRRAAG